jgi:hypothetical protein
LSSSSFLREVLNQGFFGRIQGVTGPSNRRRHLNRKRRFRIDRRIGAYSAAAPKEAFAFADDTMKSEMRGTISDLKREPLKTP